MEKGQPGDPVSGENNEADIAEASRREALQRLGVWAAYTAPTMMVLMSTKMASAQVVSSGNI
jgi:hypothetical protein